MQYTELQLTMGRSLRPGDTFRVVGVRGRFTFDYATTNNEGRIVVSGKCQRKRNFRAFYSENVRAIAKPRRNG